MMTTYITFDINTSTSPLTTNDLNIVLYDSNDVEFNFRTINDAENIVIKYDIIWNQRSSNNNIADETYTYCKYLNFRGNMIDICKSLNENSPLKIINHRYEYVKNNNMTYNTVIKIYTISGKIFIRNIKISFAKSDFFNSIGDIDILNSQFIDNDYNYLFFVANTKNKGVVNFCLKQQANLGDVIIGGDEEIIEPDEFIGEIVTINDLDCYICTINGLNPLFKIR